jgi:hypothetical protein
MRALIQVEGIWSICCELINIKISTVIKLGTRIVNIMAVASKTLHSEGIYC